MGKKGNILGDPFKDFVRKQINQRQESLGKYTNIENKDLLYYNSKTPWLRLASSIDIDSDSQTAKDYILQGGVVNYTSGEKNDNLTPMKSGIGVGGAYKFLKDEDRGNVPLPGITSADVKYENNGALTLTTVKIKCFSRAQLNIIDKLYLRPGFSMLLEFGWSVYLDNDGNLKTFDEFTTPPLDFFMNGTKNQYEIQEEIEKEQKKHCGNYEAILGVVTNFSWDIQNDGTYDCMIEMSGVGEVIETIGVEKKTEDDIVIGDSTYTQEQFKAFNELVGFDFTFSKIHTWLSHIYLEEYKNLNNTEKQTIEYEENHPLQKQSITPLPKDNLIVSSISPTWLGPDAATIVWVRFGRLLEFIEKDLLGNDKSNNPFPKFGVNYKELENDKNYIQINKYTISTDPGICIVPFKIENILSSHSSREDKTNVNIEYWKSAFRLTLDSLKITKDTKYKSLYTKLQEFKGFINENDSYKGRLMNVGLNMVYIAKTVEKYLDRENGHFSVLEFLQTIISDINKCLGGINEIEIQSDKGYVRFISKSPNQLKKVDINNISTLNIHGVIPNADDKNLEGSFIRNANVKSEIPKNFSSMVAIGAMANNVAVSQNVSNFQKYNEGLEDRIITHSPRKTEETHSDPMDPLDKIFIWDSLKFSSKDGNLTAYYTKDGKTIKLTPEQIEASKNERDLNKNKLLEEKRKKEEMENIQNTFTNLYFNNVISEDNITFLQSFIFDKSKKQQKEDIDNLYIETPFFLPYNVSLDMDGLSGMTLYQKFKTTKTIFPSDYETKNMNLVVNSLNHNITPQSWITQISAIPHPEPELKSESNEN